MSYTATCHGVSFCLAHSYFVNGISALYLPLESTLMKKGGEREGGLWLTPSGFRRTPSPRNPLAPGLCPVPCPGLVGVANPLRAASSAARGIGLVRSYFADLNRFCTCSPIVAVPTPRIHCYFDQEASP